jgi:hypothetical protein
MKRTWVPGQWLIIELSGDDVVDGVVTEIPVCPTCNTREFVKPNIYPLCVNPMHRKPEQVGDAEESTLGFKPDRRRRDPDSMAGKRQGPGVGKADE